MSSPIGPSPEQSQGQTPAPKTSWEENVITSPPRTKDSCTDLAPEAIAYQIPGVYPGKSVLRPAPQSFFSELNRCSSSTEEPAHNTTVRIQIPKSRPPPRSRKGRTKQSHNEVLGLGRKDPRRRKVQDDRYSISNMVMTTGTKCSGGVGAGELKEPEKHAILVPTLRVVESDFYEEDPGSSGSVSEWQNDFP